MIRMILLFATSMLAACSTTPAPVDGLTLLSPPDVPRSAREASRRPLADEDMQDLAIRVFERKGSTGFPFVVAVRNLGERSVRIVYPVTVFANETRTFGCETYDPALDVAVWLGPHRSMLMPVPTDPRGTPGMTQRIGVMVVDGNSASPCSARVLWSENSFADAVR